MQSIGVGVTVPVFGSQGGGALALNAYNYTATPTFSTRYGYGNKTNNRVDLRPTGRRILIDGGSGNVGNYYHVVSMAAAKALASGGDWILLPGGTTSAVGSTWSLSGLASGTSTVNMTVIGTYDPAHNTNAVADEAFYNTLKYTLDSSTAVGTDAVTMFGSSTSNVAFVNIKFSTTLATQSQNVYCLGGGSSNLYWENCTFDGVQLLVQAVPNQSVTLTSVGTTATALLAVANLLMQTGDKFNFSGATAGTTAYNGTYVITVVDSTHVTYTFAGTAGAPATGSTLYDCPFSRISDSQLMLNCGIRNCGLMYGSNGTSASGNTGNVYISGMKNWRDEGSVNFSGGMGRGIGRATPSANGGPNILKHGYYIDDYSDNSSLMDIVTAWDSCNLKLTGGNFYIQNMALVRSPMGWIYTCTTGNHGGVSFATGTLRSESMLQIESDDCNTADSVPRGQSCQTYTAATGSYLKNSLLVNLDNPTTINRLGLVFGALGSTIVSNVSVDGGVWGSWVQDPNAAPDGFTTVTYTNSVWGNASSGSNTLITSMPALYQTRLTNASALNIHTTLRTAFPNWFSGVTVGGSNLITEANMFEFMCNNPIPSSIYNDPNVTSWATLFQYHYRSKLAGTT